MSYIIIFDEKQSEMKQLERLKLIYNLLKVNRLNINEILNRLNEKKIQISRRQLERDLLDVKKYIVNENEEFFTIKLKRKNYFQIQLKSKIIDSNYINNKKPQIEKSNFYIRNKNVQFYKTIEQLNNAISNHKLIVIEDLKYDFTGDNYIQNTKIIEFAPVKLIKHRGTIYVIGFNVKDFMELLIYDVDQLINIIIRKEVFDFELLSRRVQIELEKRFGVTKNINHEIYNIQLEFTNALGIFIKKFHWHSSQKFQQKSNNETLIMNMKCGINRELLGWICQWMYNVKIISPPILQDYYLKTISQMQSISSQKQPFVYKNIFEPKE
jgi:hypothetical protein